MSLAIERTNGMLRAAQALRQAALNHPDVAALSRRADFVTLGRGASVEGVALSQTGETILAQVGLVLNAETIGQGRRVQERAASVRAALERAWQEGGFSDAPPRMELHLLDLAEKAVETPQ